MERIAKQSWSVLFLTVVLSSHWEQSWLNLAHGLSSNANGKIRRRNAPPSRTISRTDGAIQENASNDRHIQPSNERMQQLTYPGLRKEVTLPPHAGYHGGVVSSNNPTKPFFEGWYLRVVLPPSPSEEKKFGREAPSHSLSSFALIFHIFDPHSTTSTRQGVGMQVVTPLGNVIVESPNVSRFHADSHNLDVKNKFYSKSHDIMRKIQERRRRIRRRRGGSPEETGVNTDDEIGDYFKLSANHVSGMASSSSWCSSLTPSTPDFVATNNDKQNQANRSRDEVANKKSIESIKFEFDIIPQVGWGGALYDGDVADDERQRQYSTAGWMAALPIFEPHYQVLISKGKIPPGGRISIKEKSGDIASEGRHNYNPAKNSPNGDSESAANLRTESQVSQTNATSGAIMTKTVYDLTNATVYLEKNWGGSFPSKWWWMQANTFQDTLESATKAPSFSSIDLCVTSTGAKRRIPFLEQEEPVALIGLHWNGEFLPFPNVNWEVQWGIWEIRGDYGEYYVELCGTCDESSGGMPVRCPTERGMEEIAIETFHGKLRVKLFKKDRTTLLLDVTSNEACLEIGGAPWRTEPVWKGESEMVEPVKSIAMNVELEKSVSDALQVLSRFVEIPGL